MKAEEQPGVGSVYGVGCRLERAFGDREEDRALSSASLEPLSLPNGLKLSPSGKLGSADNHFSYQPHPPQMSAVP